MRLVCSVSQALAVVGIAAMAAPAAATGPVAPRFMAEAPAPAETAPATGAGETAAPGSWDWLGLPGKVQSRGQVAIEGRAFTESGSPLTEDRGLGLFGRFEWQHQHGRVEERLRVFGRVDAFDSKRNIFRAEEAFVQFREGRLRVRLGADIVNWSALEAFHPADVLNARNLDSDIENFEKIGEPMLAVQLGLFEGTTLQLYWMPMYVRSVFPSAQSRLNLAPPGVDLQERGRLFNRHGRFTEARFGPQAAVRVQQRIGSAELSVHYLEHMDRLQGLPAADANTGQPVLAFQTQRQIGVTYQQAFQSGILAKFEAGRQRFVQPADPVAEARAARLVFAGAPFPDRDHFIYAGGVEYAIEHGWATSTLLLEGQVLNGIDRSQWPSVSLFPRNVLLGYRLAFATQDSREVRASFTWNVDQPEQRFFNLVYEQRLGEQYTFRAGYRAFTGRDVPVPVGFDALSRGDHIFLNLVRHF